MIFFLISGDYVLYGYYKAAIHPYIVLKGDNIYCRSICDNDIACNGYSIDVSTNDCFLSSCNLYTDAPVCSTCYFASKATFFSNVVCPSTTSPILSTTTFQSIIMPQTTTLIEYITMKHQYVSLAETIIKIRKTTEAIHSTSLIMNDSTQVFTLNNTLCACICKNTNETLKESVERRRQELIMNKIKISSFIRKLTSAQDDRKTSEVIGAVSAIILVLFALIIFCIDILNVLCRRTNCRKGTHQ